MPVQGDATWAALQRIAQDGSDLGRPLQMDFFVAVPNEESGQVVASRASALGFTTSVERDSETGAWTCYCTKIIIPRYEIVAGIESQLDALAYDVDGYSDGFGTFGNAQGSDVESE
jgi:hypothetical protein